ncbi:hypothetical protein BGAL_0228g00110 [Botrytis galanthina]|uniref:Uncharacterized protein n=1 Tax=Botrytis galanthina TaxID=278940 RepID=A0A4S8QU12_9HELO|nr:hypothetical protein BGAL_0228g00110 [Botrytis galanthina]
MEYHESSSNGHHRLSSWKTNSGGSVDYSLFKATDIDTARTEGRERLTWRGVPDEEKPQGTERLAEILKIVELTPFPNCKRDAAWLSKADEYSVA